MASTVDHYAVIGNPIAHSKSPIIHAMFVEQTGEQLVYERLLAPLEEFAQTVRAFFARGGRGLNVTVPFKEQAFALAARHTPRAQRAGAVNTLWRDAESIVADNTDGAGLVRDLRDNLGVPIDGQRVLLIGAGGAARGVLHPLLESGASQVVVVNRSRARADALAATVDDLRCVTRDFLTLDGAFDLIINATSASLAGDIPPVPASAFARDAVAYDLMYSDRPTLFLEYAQMLGVTRVSDGLGMLVEQGAEAFEIWRGQRPQTRGVIEQLRYVLRTEGHRAL